MSCQAMKRHKSKLLSERSSSEKASQCMNRTTETVTVSMIAMGLVMGRLEWVKQDTYLGVAKLFFMTL